MIPYENLLLTVRIGFLQQGTTLAKWCADQGLSRQWVTSALKGKRCGPAAIEIRKRVMTAAVRQAA